MTLRRFALPALLTASLAATPSFAADPPTAADLAKAIENLEKATKSLQEAKDALSKLEEVRGKQITLGAEIDILKRDMADLKKRLDAPSTTALKPNDQGPTTSFLNMGRVRFINEHPLTMSVVVNGLSYRLTPGEERLIPVAPGSFTYEVLQIHRGVPRVRQIAANQVKTFTIYAE